MQMVLATRIRPKRLPRAAAAENYPLAGALQPASVPESKTHWIKPWRNACSAA